MILFRDLRAAGGQLQPQVDHVLVRSIALYQRGFAILPAPLAFRAGEPNHVAGVFGQGDVGAGHGRVASL
jgi:hypothetical protein